jgi:hypothetical protein
VPPAYAEATPAEKAMAARATSLNDSDFAALKERMKPEITQPCPVTASDGQKVLAPVEVCSCIRDAFFDKATKEQFEHYAVSHEVHLSGAMRSAQESCLLKLPPPKVTSDERYNVLQAALGQCIAARTINGKPLAFSERNLCSCIATKRIAMMDEAQIMDLREKDLPPLDTAQTRAFERACATK